jgi:hypothetical protein
MSPAQMTREQVEELLRSIPSKYDYLIAREGGLRSRKHAPPTRLLVLRECNKCGQTFGARQLREHKTLCGKPVVECRWCGKLGGKFGMAKHENKCEKNPAAYL